MASVSPPDTFSTRGNAECKPNIHPKKDNKRAKFGLIYEKLKSFMRHTFSRSRDGTLSVLKYYVYHAIYLEPVDVQHTRAGLTKSPLVLWIRRLTPGRRSSSVCEARTQTKIYLVFRRRHSGCEVPTSEHEVC